MTADRDFTPDDVRLVDLLRQLQALSPEDAETAGRITLRDAQGRYVGEALLSSKAMDAATEALTSVNAMHAMDKAEGEREILAVWDIDTSRNADTADLHPLLEADFEESCIGIDAGYLMELAATDPGRALAEFDEMHMKDRDL